MTFLVLLTATESRAGYDLTISHSATDPDVNASATPIGLDSLFLWLKCADEGISALEVEVVSDMTLFGFTPLGPVLNVGSGSTLMLAIPGCPAGDSTNVILGWFGVWDSDSTGGRIRLEAASGYADPVVVSCDSTLNSHAFVPRAVGFASDGGEPDTTGSAFGCGVFPKMIPIESSGSLPYSWSEDYGQPPSGKGTDAAATLIRRLPGSGDTFIVGGKFGDVGSLSVPNVARLVRNVATWETSWDLPSAWSGLAALATGTSYLAADQEPSGALLFGGNDWDQPLVVCPPSASCFEDPPPVEDFYSRAVHGIEHWGPNDRFLVVGDLQGPTGPEPELAEFHGLAQYNPDAEISHWEPFGYPIADDLYWIEFDGISGAAGVANVVTELNLPGKPLNQAVIVGGDFEYVFGYVAGALNMRYTAWLDPADGSFEEIYGLSGEVKTIAQSPDYLAADGGTYVYSAGDFGAVEGGEGLEMPPVMRATIGGVEPGVWTPLVPGSYPHPGPMTQDEFTSAVIHKLIATRDHLYAIGDFDRVLEHRGATGFVACHGFARFSFATQQWESLGPDALNAPGLTGEIAWPSVFVGGEFTEVGGVIPSYHIAEAIFDGTMSGVPTLVSQVTDLQFEKPRPNPARRSVQLLYSIPRSMEVDLTLYDVAGRLVRRLRHGPAEAGTHLADWDGRNADGKRCSPGIYLARITAGASSLTRKVTVLR